MILGRFERLSPLLVSLVLLGCGPADDDAATSRHQATALVDQEDAVCGMLVRDQSAPRGQVVHRDGSRFFFCSLGDMLIHLGAPSPHGRAEAFFVEVMEEHEDPAQSHTGDHPWVLAGDATYVVGIKRQRIMGRPILAYADKSTADRVMEKHGGARVLDLAELRGWWDSGNSAN